MTTATDKIDAYYLTVRVDVARFARRRGGPEIGVPLRFDWACHPMGYEGANNPSNLDPNTVRRERLEAIEAFASDHPDDRIIVKAYVEGRTIRLAEINASDEPGDPGIHPRRKITKMGRVIEL